MRWLTLLLVACLVLAVSSPAWGFTFLQPYNGPISMKFVNWDVGALYTAGNGEWTGEGTLDGLSQTAPPDGFNGEDSWGVAQLVEIRGINGNEIGRASCRERVCHCV